MNALGSLKHSIKDVMLQCSQGGLVPERYKEKSEGKILRFFLMKTWGYVEYSLSFYL